MFRLARHTNNLPQVIQFYTEVIGLERLGGFEDHEGYDGVFLGHQMIDWHLEFNTSKHNKCRKQDPDDMVVFYFYSKFEIDEILRHASRYGIQPITARNPYWKHNGVMIVDPDGNHTMLAKKYINLNRKNKYTDLLLKRNIKNWSSLLNYVRHLPYGRTQNTKSVISVLKEEKGTCSSKHALLKKIAQDYQLNHVKLILGLYRMTSINTPGIGDAIKDAGLDYLPEAHCYLNVFGKRIDLTNRNSSIGRIEDDLIKEIEIEPDQIGPYKVDLHKAFLTHWIEQNNIDLTLTQIWTIRETCIKNLSNVI